jgi:hypothetical protein
VVSFTILGWIGTRIDQEAPLLPDRVETTDGTVVIDRNGWDRPASSGTPSSQRERIE